MKEATSSTWSFGIILIFILIFACFLALVITYSKAYTIKNRMLTIIEKYEGITEESGQIINAFASNKSYRTKGKCPFKDDDTGIWYGAIDLEGDFDVAEKGEEYYYCFMEGRKNGEIYYEVSVFFNFNLPFLGEFTTFKVQGATQSFEGNEFRITK